MRYLFPVLAIMILGMYIKAYPIPVTCRSRFHEPTIPGAFISQPFGHLAHVGDDYSIDVSTKLYAVMDGIVMYAVEDSRVYGRSIFILNCDGYGVLYGHLSELNVKFGEIVRSGQLIGLSGGDPKDDIDGDGWSGGAHLHFEVRIPGHLDSNLYNLDPAKYVIMTEHYGQLPVDVR